MNDSYIGIELTKFDASYSKLKDIRDSLSDHNDGSVATIKNHGNNLVSKGPVATGLKDTGDVIAKISQATLAYMDGILKYLDHVKTELIKVNDEVEETLTQ